MVYKMIVIIIIFPFFILSQTKSRNDDYDLWVISESAPHQMWTIINNSHIEKDYDVNLTRLNPFYYYGDFDGDGKTDYAVFLTSKQDKRDRLAIFAGDGKVHWLDKDDELRYPTITAWYVHQKNWKVENSPFEDTTAPKLIGDALMILKVEASSALIYWNGERFVSYWQGD